MRRPELAGLYFLEGRWRYEARTPAGRVRKAGWIRNGVTDAALNDLQEVYFRGGSQRTTWYAGLLASSGFTGLASTDTLGSHAGWSEFTGYAESTRRQWSPAAAASGRLLNSGAMSFTFSVPVTIQGLLLASNSTKGGTTGLLWSTGQFDSPESWEQGEVMRLFYDLTAAPGAG